MGELGLLFNPIFFFGQNGCRVGFAMFRKLHPDFNLFIKVLIEAGAASSASFCTLQVFTILHLPANQRLTIWLLQFHISCVGVKTPLPDKWYCPECIKTKNAASEKRKGRKKWLNTTCQCIDSDMSSQNLTGESANGRGWLARVALAWCTSSISKLYPGNWFAGSDSESLWTVVAVESYYNRLLESFTVGIFGSFFNHFRPDTRVCGIK